MAGSTELTISRLLLNFDMETKREPSVDRGVFTLPISSPVQTVSTYIAVNTMVMCSQKLRREREKCPVSINKENRCGSIIESQLEPRIVV